MWRKVSEALPALARLDAPSKDSSAAIGELLGAALLWLAKADPSSEAAVPDASAVPCAKAGISPCAGGCCIGACDESKKQSREWHCTIADNEATWCFRSS